MALKPQVASVHDGREDHPEKRHGECQGEKVALIHTKALQTQKKSPGTEAGARGDRGGVITGVG